VRPYCWQLYLLDAVKHRRNAGEKQKTVIMGHLQIPRAIILDRSVRAEKKGRLTLPKILGTASYP
jgi:hypothetical protein